MQLLPSADYHFLQERYSVIRSLAAVERARVCVILIDATEGFTEQDSKVAGFAHEQGKACIIAVNKWDAVEKDDKTDFLRSIPGIPKSKNESCASLCLCSNCSNLSISS